MKMFKVLLVLVVLVSASGLTAQDFKVKDATSALLMHVRGSGITDINQQSRARAFLTIPQVIPPNIWTPIEFDDDTTPPGGYDQHGEFTVSTPPGNPGVFTPTETGFYQINARTDFTYSEGQLVAGGYVSIAIFVNGAMYAQGNKLQMLGNFNELLPNNGAPNVSDVVWLQSGDIVDIRVIQTITVAAPLSLVALPLPSQTYVSIHKSS